MILLFTPPFDKSERDPGYIKGYLPGVRENGGQYTHAAIWTAWAFAKLGQAERVMELFRMLNPISHADTPEKAARYKVEPVIIAADIYSQTSHTVMDGWTWYTGSSSWMYRLGIEAILGISRVGKALKINVENPDGINGGVRQVLLDGNPLSNNLSHKSSGIIIPLVDDGRQHTVQILMGTDERDHLL